MTALAQKVTRRWRNAALFMIFPVKNKVQSNAKGGHTKVADWQDVGVEKSTADRCRIATARLEIRQILRAASYCSIDYVTKL